MVLTIGLSLKLGIDIFTAPSISTIVQETVYFITKNYKKYKRMFKSILENASNIDHKEICPPMTRFQ